MVMTPQQTSAYDQMNAFLESIGLNPADYRQLVEDAAIHDTSPVGFSQILQTTPQFKAAFPEIEARRKAGYDPKTVGEIISYRSQAKALARDYGLPAGFLSSQMITDLFANDVSPDELNARIIQGFNAVNNAPQEVRDTLFNYYGIDQGHLAAFFLDPTAGEANIQKAVASTMIGTAGQRVGFGLSREEAEMLAGGKVSAEQAATGLSQLVEAKELFGALPGEAATADITREAQLGTLTAPTGVTAQELEKRGRQRRARFGGGGGYAESQQGVTGLGQE